LCLTFAEAASRCGKRCALAKFGKGRPSPETLLHLRVADLLAEIGDPFRLNPFKYFFHLSPGDL